MTIQLHGRWSLSVTKAIHSWENRFRIQGATTGSGTYPPTVGLAVVADGASWSLVAEYRESTADGWKPSEMMIDPGVERVDILATIGAEDPLPSRDFEDIQWEARYLGGTMLEIPYRPYAVRTTDLFQMPDGIFEAALGTYYMAVRVVNRWGLPFTENHVLDITPESRAILAARGIVVLDGWSNAELAALGQTQLGSGIVLGPLVPGAARTVYFKVNVSGAAPRKHEVEFVCWNMAGMQDVNNPNRRVRKHIFVSRTRIDQTTGEVVSEVQEGTLRFSLKQFAFDRETAYKGRRRLPKRPGGPGRDPAVREAIREALKSILDGREVDPCEVLHLLACHCTGNGRPGGPRDPDKPHDGRFEYDPFYAFPTRFSFSVTPRTPYTGQYGPIPYQDPWWKVLLLIIAAILLIAALLEQSSDLAYHDEDLVIGTLNRWSQNDIDAALCLLDTDRALGFSQVLDAQSDEDNQGFINALDGLVNVSGPVMTRAEIDDILLTTPPNDPRRRVFKSGATTGLTHGMIRTLAPDGHDKATWGIDQLIIDRDPAFGEDVSIPGDSGSVWVHTATLRPIALNHSGSRDANDNPTGDTAWASLLEDVFARMGITL
ncbi:hypothetical protein [Archangium lipolyticum]|uniref:hypothetical protein n=1 Tax=Archangium lipolyticum TaxID=2970465 RepID=UPI00214A3CE4|nr:hypothetical protein [Archangium lipolyticum]